jgi:HSP20 family protein
LTFFFHHSENTSQTQTIKSSLRILSHYTVLKFKLQPSIQNNMPFFPQAYLSSEANLIQLLSELDHQPTQRKACGPRFARQQTFTPKFDVTEVAEAYELYGELPGLEQNDISIEWTDAQTIVVKGKTERPSTTPATEAAHTQPEASKDAETSSEKSHAATVEDDYDEADTPLATPATTATAVNDVASQQQQAETPRAKYWVAERKVGEFARSFSFSQRVEQDFVTATLKNGVLHIVVPKSQKPKKVAVNVY